MRVVTCEYCGATVAAEEGVVSAAAYRRARAELDEAAREAADVHVGGLPYRLIGRIGTGESSEVFLAERAHRISERVIVKLLRARDDAALFDREWDTLGLLHASTTEGAPQMTRRLPQLVARGTARGLVDERPALVMRAASGFVHTLDDVRTHHSGGVDARHAVWMWRRILELLGWVHRAGFAHGAVLPQHLIVHARDHGVMLVGWSCSGRIDRAGLVATSGAHADYYPEGAALDARTDLVMSARCMAAVLGGDASGRVPASVPEPIASIVRAASQAVHADAWALKDVVTNAAREVYGAPRYEPFAMPGWRT